MKVFRLMVGVSVLFGALLFAPRTASANVFCPATIDALENLATLGRGNTYGVLMSVDPGNLASARLRIDSETTAYALDFNDLNTISSIPTQYKRYFTLPDGQHVISAWIDSTGVDQISHLPCQVTHPFDLMEPAPTDSAVIARSQAMQRDLRDSFSSRTPTLTPTAFGPITPRTCAQPYAPAHTVTALQPIYPPEARAVRAVGITTVRVDIDESSTIIDATVIRTSGYAPLDRAAREAALKSTYHTATFACRAVASSYDFKAIFNGP